MLPLALVLTLVLAQDRNAGGAHEHETATGWRTERRLIDLHLHVAYEKDKLARAVRIMDEVGIGIGVNLSGGHTLGKEGGALPLRNANKALADSLHPGRFVHYMNLDYGRWNELDFSKHAVHQIEEGHRLGAAGLKEYKRLGLYLKDDQAERPHQGR